MDDAFLATVTQRYVELHEKVTGKDFKGDSTADPHGRISEAVEGWLSQHKG